MDLTHEISFQPPTSQCDTLLPKWPLVEIWPAGSITLNWPFMNPPSIGGFGAGGNVAQLTEQRDSPYCSLLLPTAPYCSPLLPTAPYCSQFPTFTRHSFPLKLLQPAAEKSQNPFPLIFIHNLFSLSQSQRIMLGRVCLDQIMCL